MKIETLLDELIEVVGLQKDYEKSGCIIEEQQTQYRYIDMMNANNNKYIRSIRECNNYNKWTQDNIAKLIESYKIYKHNIKEMRVKVFPEFEITKLYSKIEYLKQQGRIE